MILRILIITLIISSEISCKPRPSFKAPSKFFQQDLEEGPPDFKDGWRDGCNSGMGAGSNSFNQMFYHHNTQDGYKVAYSPQYRSAWTKGFWFCYRADYIDQKSTPYGSLFGGVN